MEEFPPTRAKFAMCMAFLGIVCPVFSPPALVLANISKEITAVHPGHPDTMKVAIARFISIATLTFVFAIFLGFVYVVYSVGYAFGPDSPLLR